MHHSASPNDRASIDPVTFEVIYHGLDSVVNEMALTVMRTAYSGIVKDSMDYSTAFCDARGNVIAQGLTIIVHLNSFPDAVAAILTGYGDRMEPGDIFVANDPYGSGGIHLPDIFVIKPIFIDGELEGFTGSTAHHTDVGGLVPGSNSTDSTEIYQEGIRIPTLKLFARDVPNETLFAIIEKNVRVPHKVLGDIRAQVAAVNTGERGYRDLVTRYGREMMRNFQRRLLAYTEELVRAEIQEMPDGKYECTGHIDADNIDAGPLTVQLALTVDGDQMILDFSGSSPQVKAGINCVPNFTKSAVLRAVRMTMDPTIPNSSGYHHLIDVRAPEGTIVNCLPPAAMGARGITGFRISDVVFGALAKAIPDRVPADGDGGNTIISIGGYDRDSQPFAYVDLVSGARGGRPMEDGPEGVPYPGGNISNVPVEIAEVELPIRIEEYSIRADTEGPGKYRGALSQVRRVRCLADEATLQLRSDKRRFPPLGLQGGKPGHPSWNILNPGPEEVMLPTMSVTNMVRDDVILHIMASGGGWGDPFDRDSGLVRADVWNEKISTERARDEYGVVVDSESFEIDEAATEALRDSPRP